MEPLRQAAAAALVLGLLAGLLWLLRRPGALAAGCGPVRGGKKILSRAGRLSLSPHHTVELVRVGPRILVLALHTSGCSLLGTLAAEEVEEEAPPAGGRKRGSREAENLSGAAGFGASRVLP